MCLNHLLLPASLSSRQPTDFYRRLILYKRLIIATIIAAGYGFYLVIELNEGLASLGLISFVAAAQLLPGVIGLLFWPRATRAGFLIGLLGGAFVWFALLIWPLLQPGSNPASLLLIDTDIWTLSTFCTLSVNGMLFVLGSLMTQPSVEEQAASWSVLQGDAVSVSRPAPARSPVHYRYALQQALGSDVAEQELGRALDEAGIDANESRSAELQLLHERLERNLTGLLGPTLARSILRHSRSLTDVAGAAELPDARWLELRLEDSRQQMRGLTKQLDDLRRYLRDVLREMPVGVCSVSADGTVVLWNTTMVEVTNVPERSARNTPISSLPAPWGELLSSFATSDENHRLRHRVSDDAQTQTVNLHKADIGTPSGSDDALSGQVILMEDQTSIETLESELAHSERLASIGRLAAGVAHEIGNPLTGIASISQNLLHDAETERGNDAEELKEQAGDILTQVTRINSIVRSLLTFSHSDGVSGEHREAVSIKASVNEALRLIQLSPQRRHLDFQVDVGDGLVLADPNQLVQVFVNLLNNASDAAPAGSSVVVVQDQSPSDGPAANDDIVVRVSDRGNGIDPAARDRIFEPFFTTKSVGQGTGLGLSLVYSIISNHGGKIRVEDNTPSGTSMVITLPRVSTSAVIPSSLAS